MMKNSTNTGVMNKKRSGIAMMLVLIAVAAATILSLTFINTQSTSTHVASNIRDHASAQTVAESGLQIAVEEIRLNSEWRNTIADSQWIANQSINGGDFTITIEDGVDMDGNGTVDGDGDLTDNLSDPVTLTSVGQIDGVSHTVKAVALPVLTRDRKAVFVVPSGKGLNEKDIARKELIESFEWTVETISDNDSQDAFDQMLKDAQVAIVSSRVNPDQLGSKLRGSKKGVVSEQMDNYSDMDLSNGTTTTYTSTDVNVTNTDHYITETLTDGNVQVFTESQEMGATDTSDVGNGDILGEKNVGSGASLVVADSGEVSNSGDYIEGRRVWLPWGGENTDVTALTDSGKELFERAIAWAGRQAGTGSAEVGIVVTDKIDMRGNTYIDSYDSNRGPYNATYNNGDQAVVVSNNTGDNKISLENSSQIKGEVFVAPMADPDATILLKDSAVITGDINMQEVTTGIPSVELPADFPTSVGDIALGPYNYYLNSNYHANRFIMSNYSTLYIVGDVTIVCDEKFYMGEYTRLSIQKGSTLTIYTPYFEINGYYSQANTSYGDPEQLNICITGDKKVKLDKAARLYATVFAPNGELEVKLYSEFYGSFLGKYLTMSDNGAFHQDIKNVEKPLPPLRYELTVVWEEGL